MEIPEAYIYKPTKNGKFQIFKYNTYSKGYIQLQEEMHLLEDIAIECTKKLNDYEDKINNLSNNYSYWGVDDAIETYNKLKSREAILSDKENQLMIDANKRIVYWNNYVNETGKIYQDLIDRGIAQIPSPYKYSIKGIK